MDFLFNLSGYLDWIRENIINALMGPGFEFLRAFFTTYIQIKPILDLLGM